MENIKNACALTGHRILDSDFSESNLELILNDLILNKGVTVFYCGMAIGFDLTACKILCDIRKKQPQIKIIACIPCPEQSIKFGEKNKRIYDSLLESCDEKIIVSPCYDRGCMHVRNRYMVDRAQFLVAYCKQDKGGTANTVNYALKKEREILFVL